MENTAQNLLPEPTSILDRFIALTVLPFLPSRVTPNHITVFRMCTVPFVAYLFLSEIYLLGLIVFTTSAFTDVVDGALARTKNQITEWGKLFDPFADKLLIATAAVILIASELSLWLASTVIFVELCLIANALYEKKVKGRALQAVHVGKIKMFLQCLGVIFILIAVIGDLPKFIFLAEWSLYISILFGASSLLVYRSI